MTFFETCTSSVQDIKGFPYLYCVVETQRAEHGAINVTDGFPHPGGSEIRAMRDGCRPETWQQAAADH